MALGERIVNELELENSTDTLGRWMAHRVADLIDAGAKNESARTEAANLILRVWERRSAWPQGWPPPESLAVLEALTPRRRRAAQETPEESGPWLERLPALWAVHQEESDIWRDLALMEIDLEEELEEIDELAEALSDDERRLFNALRLGRRAAEMHFDEVLGERSAERSARIELARSELRALGRKRGALLRAAIAGRAGGSRG